MARPSSYLSKRLRGSLKPLAAVLTLACALLLAPQTTHAACGPANPAAANLLGHWTFDETSGSTITDSGSGGNDGTWSDSGDNDVTGEASTGKIGGAFNFTANSERVSIGSPANLDNLATKTLSAWIYVRNGSDWGRIFDKLQGGTSSWRVMIDNNNALLYHHGWSGGSGNWSTAANAIPDYQWTHIAVSYDDSSTANDPVIYLNGEPVTVNEDATPSGTVNNDTTNLTLGGRSNGAQSFNGYIDDMRIYNTILSDQEVEELYRSFITADAGTMIYNARTDALEYCNGTDWVHAGVGSYNPIAVEFDGTNDYLSTISSISDSKIITGSFWFRHNNSGVVGYIHQHVADDLAIWITNSNLLVIEGNNSGGTEIIAIENSTNISDGEWHHVMFSFDLSDTNKRHLYIDGSSDLTVFTYTDDVLLLNGFNIGIGADSGGFNNFDGDIADYWFTSGVYIDLSVQANREKFRSANGMPMYLGPDCSLPIGKSPNICLTGDTDDWHTNKGTGGGFTENGAIEYSSSQPADGLIPTGDIASGLIGYWKLDETSGNTVADSSGNGYDGTWFSGTNNSTDGIIGTALIFSGDEIHGNSGTEPLLDITAPPITIATWIKKGSTSETGRIFRKLGRYKWGVGDDAPCTSTQMSFIKYGYINLCLDGVPADTDWHHYAIVVDTANTYAYIDGILVDSVSDANPMGGSTAPFEIKPFGINKDDVRVYNRALTATDISLLVACDTGTLPGTLQYDPDFNVMEYCNGVEWVAMGPVGGTPPTSGLVGHWALDETSGSSITDASGNGNTGTWTDGVNNDVTDETADGQVETAIDFDGTDDVINVGSGISLDDIQLQGGGGMTISAWVKPASGNSNSAIATKDEVTAGSGWGIYIPSSGGLGLGFGVNRSTTEMLAQTAGGTLTADEWQHITVTWNGGLTVANDIDFYINGQPVSQNYSEAGSGALASDASKSVYIGNNIWGSADFDGSLDDVRIYNRTLSNSEIQQLYYYGLSGGLGDVDNTCSDEGPITGSTAEGIIFYNSDHSVMQYCNGENWIGIGQ